MMAISIFTFPNKLVIKIFQKTIINLNPFLHADEEALKQFECASSESITKLKIILFPNV